MTEANASQNRSKAHSSLFAPVPALLDMQANPEKGDTVIVADEYWRVARVVPTGMLILRRGLWPLHKSRLVWVEQLYPLGGVLEELGLKPGGETTIWRLRSDVFKGKSGA